MSSTPAGPENPHSLDALTAIKSNFQSRPRKALNAYKTLEANKDLPNHRLLTFRCRVKGCLLLDVFDTEDGPALYWPPHRRSDDANAVTDPQARATRTVDGDRTWIDRADTLDVMLQFEAWVNCAHVRDARIPGRAVEAKLRDVAGLKRRHPDRTVIISN